MRKLLAVAFLAASFLLPHLSLAAFDATTPASSTGLSATAGEAYGTAYRDAPANQNLGSFIGARIIAPAFGLVGTLFFALMVWGGFLYMTAHGNPKQVDKAKDVLTTAVIGVVIIVSAYVLTTTVLTALTTG